MKRIRHVRRESRYLTIFLICSIVPIIFIVCMLFFVIQKKEHNQHQKEVEHAAERLMTEIKSCINIGIVLSDTIYLDDRIYSCMNKEYKNALEYYREFCEFSRMIGLKYTTALSSTKDVAIYTMNPTILSGTLYYSLADEPELPYKFRYLQANGVQELYYEYSGTSAEDAKFPKLELVRRLDYYDVKYPIYLDIQYDMNTIAKCINYEKSVDEVYFTLDNTIIDARDRSFIGKAFDESMLRHEEAVSCQIEERILNLKFGIIIQDAKESILYTVKDSIPELMFVLIVVIALLSYIIHATIIQEQEAQRLMLSKVQAEMNALNSQVNPHFLYNTLESICMRSVLKGEVETSGIIQNLASIMHRMSTWGEDNISIQEEINGVNEYLLIQKYRFGDKLDYDLCIEDSCYELRIPKLSIMSLVENACVHGIGESLEDGKVRVRVYREDGKLTLLVEDTGAGMQKMQLLAIQKRMDAARIEDMTMNHGTGLLNTYLRLNNYYNNHVEFHISSIPDKGTSVRFQIQMR